MDFQEWRIGMKGAKVKEQIRDLHNDLRTLNFKIPLSEFYTTRFGKGTEKSVKEFQKNHSLEPNGVLNKKMREDLFIEAERTRRHYGTSPLPIFKAGSRLPSRQTREDIMLALYNEVCKSWGMLTDARFKLLGFVPTASIVLLIGLLSKGAPGEGLSPTSRAIVCLIGLLVTGGLYIYERRNTDLYDDLISRGRRIEYELGMDTGQFLGRRKTSSFFIKHDKAIQLIYGSAIFAWLFALIATLMNRV